jgi:hypothetical protein
MQSYEEICEKVSQSCHDKTHSRGFFTKAAIPCFCTFLTLSYFFFILELLTLKMNGAHAVRDPEPSLLDSNFIEPSKLQLLFRPSRKYVASTHFIHISVPFNFLQLLQTPNLIFNQYHQYINSGPNLFAPRLKKLQKSADHVWLIKLTILWISWMLFHNTLQSHGTSNFWT